MSRPIIMRYTSDLLVDDFDCGDEEVNDFLKNKAAEQIRQHITKVYVIRIENTVIGYYACFSSHLYMDLPETPDKFLRVPGVCLGQLGVDLNYANKGLGKELIKHCIAIAHRISELTACRIIWLEAYDDMVEYYINNGFSLVKRSKDRNRMFLDLFPQQ